MVVAVPSKLECKNCNYFGYSEESEHEHCIFRKLCGDYETAPCDENEYPKLGPIIYINAYTDKEHAMVFVNDYDNDTKGVSCGKFATTLETIKDYESNL